MHSAELFCYIEDPPLRGLALAHAEESATTYSGQLQLAHLYSSYMDPVRDPLTAPLTIPLAYLNKSLYEIDQAATHTPVLYPNFRGPRIMRNFPHTGGKTIHVSSPFSGVCALSPGAFFPLQRAPSLYGDTYKFRKRLCTLSPPPKRGGCLWSDSFLAHHPLPPKRTHFAPTTNSTIS